MSPPKERPGDSRSASVDDLSDDRIQRRLHWYETDVVPTIDYFRTRGEPYRVIDIDGEQPVEKVHREIIQHLGFALKA